MRTLAFSIGIGGLLFTGLVIAADKDGNAAKGKEVFDQCSVCHNTDTDEKKIGPSLKGLFKHATLKNGKKAHVTMHLIEGGEQEIRAQLMQSLDAFFEFDPEI